MSAKIREKVIKPPIERVKSGKVFKPSPALKNKMWISGLFVAFIFWVLVIGSWLGIGYLILLDHGLTSTEIWGVFSDWWLPVNFWYWAISSIYIIPGLILTPIYVNRIEYSVIAETGETMPEIYVRKGIVTITVKHVPFRTITNISSKAGPLDRILGIGSVEIQTAGISGGTQPGKNPEEKIEGIPFFEEVRDFILQELRRFQAPYVTGTELPPRRVEAEFRTSEEVMDVLKEIRDLLKEERK